MSTTDYSRYLVLYSGGADSTYFIQNNSSARHLIHYAGMNEAQTKTAVVNANILDRYLTVESRGPSSPRDGETNQIHALHDTQMAIEAGIRALSFGMKGIVMCFNADDLAIDFDAVKSIFHRAEPSFELLTPLRSMKAAEIRGALKSGKPALQYVSCMYDVSCGHCPKCLRKY
jgi:7-cyano-7-deazaguanine synthase in queuosine biosynthesis